MRCSGATGQDRRRACVVDDDPDLREMLRRDARARGLDRGRGRQRPGGLDRLATGLPDLILLDLMMPEMDGFELRRRLRDEPAWRAIPIVVITAKDLSAEDRER